MPAEDILTRLQKEREFHRGLEQEYLPHEVVDAAIDEIFRLRMDLSYEEAFRLNQTKDYEEDVGVHYEKWKAADKRLRHAWELLAMCEENGVLPTKCRDAVLAFLYPPKEDDK